MRHADTGSIQQVVQQAYRAVGGIERVSDDLGLAISTLSVHTVKPEGDRKRAGGFGMNYADTLSRMHPTVAQVFAGHFAALAGGRFEPFATTGPAQQPWEHVANLAKETAEAVGAVGTLPHGGCPHDARTQLLEAREAIDAALRDLPTPVLREATK